MGPVYSRAGEVSEWFKVPLSKSGVVLSHRGFESRPLRHGGADEPQPALRSRRKKSRSRAPHSSESTPAVTCGRWLLRGLRSTS